MNRPLLVSMFSLILFTACGGPDFVGTYSAAGESVWRITVDGQSSEAHYPVQDHATVRNISSPNDYKLTLDGCDVELGLSDGDSATLIPGARCVYNLNGVPVAEVYGTATLRSTGKDRADYFATGDLVVPMQDGSDFVLGRFWVAATLWRTSEFVSSEWSTPSAEDEPPARTGPSAN